MRIFKYLASRKQNRAALLKLIIVTLVLSCSTGAWAEPWKLVWSDEFDVEGAPDPAKWSYEEGFIRNEEMQLYTRARQENVRVENGMLVIEARKERIPNPHFDPAATTWRKKRAFAEYTSGSLTTRATATWQYGRIEVRAKLPHGAGVWPAIWMLGIHYPERIGEIDIMEFYGIRPNAIQGTVHYKTKEIEGWDGGRFETNRPYSAFHVYSVEWSPTQIDIFFDGLKYRSFPVSKAGAGSENPFRQPHFLIINLALGGNAGAGLVDDQIFPQTFLIDYVRVYQRAQWTPATRHNER